MSGTGKSADWDLALRLHRAGFTHGEIARRIGRHPNTVGRGLRERGVRADRTWSRIRRLDGRRLYGLWNYLWRRCESPAHPQYRDYGAKGLRFARAWDDFDTFYDWAMAAGYAPGLHLVRINRSRNFTPGNCRWAAANEIPAERAVRLAFLVHAFGESKGQMAWARDPRCRVTQCSLRDRLKSGWPPEEAIALPAGSKPSRLVRPPKELRVERRSRVKIDWEEASRLYRDQKLSEQEIARRLGAARGSIERGLGRLGIRRRRRVAPTLSPEWLRLNQVWRNLLERCGRRSGKRGIGLAPEWREFDRFHAWARANGARKGLWLARKNRRWSYSPGNCQWVSRAEATRRRSAP